MQGEPFSKGPCGWGRALWRAGLAGLLLLCMAHAAAQDPAEQTKRLHALFEATWQANMQAHPEWATFVGDHRHGDRLTDESPEARAQRQALEVQTLQQARAIARDALSPQDRVSLDLFIHGLKDRIREHDFEGFASMSLGALGGFHTDFAELLSASPVNDAAQVEALLRRLAAYPKRVDQEIAKLRKGMLLGWVPPRKVLERVLAQLDRQITEGAEASDKSPYFEPFTRLPTRMPVDEQDALRQRGRAAIDDEVQPAQRRLRDFVAGDYLAAAPADGALLRYSQGAEVYAWRVQVHTTTDVSPAQVHALGRREVERLRKEMAAVITELKFDGDFAAFVTFATTDPRFFHTSPEAFIAAYRDIAKRIDPELPKLFAQLPRAPYGVRAMPPHFDADRADYYNGPAQDGSRPGWFMANAKAWNTQPIWAMESLTAHEAVPGHHLQISRAIELGDLPKFRREAFYTAYIEGWALYAETLGFQLGLYKDPYSRFGYLRYQALRAARLVVDTGIHALGWSRQQAIDYMLAHTGFDAGFVESEVDRYTSWPGQALAYMVGQLKIEALRDRAMAQLGPRFDIRQFHRVLLDQGAVPLSVLERAVDDWIAAQPALR
jgi:uncharacterized protein (DUF885 family)